MMCPSCGVDMVDLGLPDQRAIGEQPDRVAGRGHRNFNRTNPYFTQDRPDLRAASPERYQNRGDAPDGRLDAPQREVLNVEGKARIGLTAGVSGVWFSSCNGRSSPSSQVGAPVHSLRQPFQRPAIAAGGGSTAASSSEKMR